YRITPEQFGIERQSLDALVVKDAAQSLAMIESVLRGEKGAASDMVALNAGATIYAADLADSLEAGVTRAQEIIASGEAANKLDALAAYTQRFPKAD
ncbi:MAG: anthranilate phosphoribosyltransferase, partial [Arenicellales bacterium]